MWSRSRRGWSRISRNKYLLSKTSIAFASLLLYSDLREIVMIPTDPNQALRISIAVSTVFLPVSGNVLIIGVGLIAGPA
jgi:preprotein translocase subunit Sec61beta